MKLKVLLRTAALLSAAVYLLILGFFYRQLPTQGAPPEALRLQSVSPAALEDDGTMSLVLTGSGFDAATRVSLVLDTGNRHSVISQVPLWGRLNDAALMGEILLVAHHSRGIMSFDVSDPHRPRLLGALPVPGAPFKIEIADGYAFVCAREEGIHILEISNPRDLRIAATVKSEGLAVDIAIEGHRVFVANSLLGLQAFDLSLSGPPRPLGGIKIPGHPIAVALHQGFAFVASAKGGLQVIDIANPEAMRLAASVPTDGAAMGVSVRNGIAFVASLHGGILRFDISDPVNPRFIDSPEETRSAFSVHTSADRAYVTNPGGTVQIYALKDCAPPEHLGTVEVPGIARSVVSDGARLFVPTSRGGLQIIDVRNPRKPQALASVRLDGRVQDMQARGNEIVLATHSHELLLAEIAEEGVRISAAAGAPSMVQRLAVCDERVYAALRNGGILVYGRGKAPLQLLYTLETYPVADLAVSGSTLYATANEHLLIFDLATSGPPRHVRTTSLGAPLKAMAAERERLYLGDAKGGIYILDTRRPTEPRILGKTLLPWHMRNFSSMADMASLNGIVYLADGRNGLVVFDLRDPQEPQMIATLEFPRLLYTINVDGQWAYASDQNDGLYLVDIHNPQRPKIAAFVASGIQGRGIRAGADKVGFATADGELRLIPLPQPVETIRLLDPNRLAISFPTPRVPGIYNLRVFNNYQNAELPGAVVVQ